MGGRYPVPRPDRPRLVTKIRNDYGVLGEFFETFLGEAATKRRVAILQDMSDVLQERPDFLTFKVAWLTERGEEGVCPSFLVICGVCQVCEFRRKYGPFFDMYVVTQLVALRDDINKMEKDEVSNHHRHHPPHPHPSLCPSLYHQVLSSCQEALSSINEEEGAPPEPDTAASSPTGDLLRFVPLAAPRSPDASTQPSRTPTRGPQDAESRRQLRPYVWTGVWEMNKGIGCVCAQRWWSRAAAVDNGLGVRGAPLDQSRHAEKSTHAHGRKKTKEQRQRSPHTILCQHSGRMCVCVCVVRCGEVW